MKMAKATEKDIDAAGDALSVLQDISSGYYPKRDGDECEDTFFDPDDPKHLRTFYDLMADTLDKAPGWPGRVIGGMCYVILYAKNQIVDPDADVLEMHPRFAQVAQQRDELLAALRNAQSVCMSVSISRDRQIKRDGSVMYAQTEEWCRWLEDEVGPEIDAAIAKAEGGAA